MPKVSLCVCGSVPAITGENGKVQIKCLNCKTIMTSDTVEEASRLWNMAVKDGMPLRPLKMPAPPAVRRHAIEMWNISRQMHPGEMVDPTTLTDYMPLRPLTFKGIEAPPIPQPRTGYLTREEYDRLAKALGFAADVEPDTLLAWAVQLQDRVDRTCKLYDSQKECWAGMVDRANQRANRAADENGTLRAKLKDMEAQAAMLALELDTLKRKVGR